ncbi:MAG TPA: apolipoprotein N-acyltransferase, partial [Nitrospirota bacterium]
VLSGILLAASFPPSDLSYAAWASLIPLLHAVQAEKPLYSFWQGMACGMVFYLASVYWVINTMYSYGGLNIGVSILLLVALSAYLALYVGIFALFMNRASMRRIPFTISAPFVWVALELARNYMLSGFPWNLLGYSQHAVLKIIQVSDITGVYGVSFAVVLVNAAAADLLAMLPDKKIAWPRAAGIASAVVIIIGVSLYGGYRLNHPPVSKGTIKAALIQGNIDQSQKWDPAFRDKVFGAYTRLTLEAARQKPDIVIWPETATPFVFQDDEMRPRLFETAKLSGAYLLTGSPSIEQKDDQGYLEFNSAYLISPKGNPVGRYDKMHLVPFGEYVPAKTLLPFVSKMVTAIGDFGGGKEATVMEAGNFKFGTAICFEVIFPELVRKFADNGADFLTSVTNDAWFGRSSAPAQHFNMAVFRAVENRRALVRAANTGITGLILPTGEVGATTGIFKETMLTVDVPLVSEKTFYTRHGDLFAYFCAAVSLLIFGYLVIYRRRKNDSA